jgi:transposase
MPAPIPLPLRQAIWARYQQGSSTAELAEQFGLAPRTVRGLIRRARERGVEGLTPDSTHPDRPSPSPHPAREATLQLRREHPGWDAVMVRVWLERAGVGGLPSAREIQRWFAVAGLNPAPRGRRPQSARRPAWAPHETWQVDASERIALADGSQASWLRITDESTGAVLLTAVFPPRALGPGPRGGISKGAAAGVSPMGPPRAHPCRQRLAVGFAPG